MYAAFDPFLAIPTWHSNHDLDRERFFQVLEQVVCDPAFNADQMGVYMRQKVNNPAHGSDIDRLVSDAWAVRDFLQATGGCADDED